jgi:hypothetical protein
VAAVLSLGCALAAWGWIVCAWVIFDHDIHLGSVLSTTDLLITTSAHSFIAAIIAIVSGHIAWWKIRRSQDGQRGEELATTGLLLAYLALVLVVVSAVTEAFLFVLFSSL